MTAGGVLGLAWAVVVGGLLWPHRPRRVRRLPGGSRPTGRPGVLARVGAPLRRRAGRPPDAAADRDAGAAALASVALAVVALPLAPLPWVAALAAARVRDRRQRSATADAWAEAVPDAVDLFALAVAGGLAVPGALAVVAPRAPPPLGEALLAADTRFRHGEPLEVALGGVAERGPPARPLVTVLVAAHCDGVPLVEPLARLADELRRARQREAEARARRVPVQMLFPLVGCTLPAFVLVTVVPAVLTALADLTP